MSVKAKLFGQFTGWHMIGVLMLFFGTIISVNLTLAWFAVSSWSGLVVENSYVESQHFNEHTRQREQAAELGWKASAAYDRGVFRLELTDSKGRPIDTEVTLKVGRPATAREDRVLGFVRQRDGAYETPVVLGDGYWQADISAPASDGVTWRHSYRFHVNG